MYIEINNLEKRFNNKTIFKIDNLKIKKNDITIIKGESGIGKSTFLKILAGIDTNFKGEINFFDEFKLSNSSKNKEVLKFRRYNVGFIFQNFELIEELNIKDNIILQSELKNLKIDNKFIKEELKNIGIQKDIYTKVTSLSGGQQQRVAILRALIHNPKIVLADEPTANLDKKNKNFIIDRFNSLKNRTTLIIVTHDDNLISSLNTNNIINFEEFSV